ncbi:starch phosphorylase [Orenia metallireducens]|uniref:glycogen phosphorylase n=1 Tax=Orenia metallireducens TaxID=1413210 RepID=A0A285FXI1_9FIRM|nr:alpha-glucan family phosphorylase [Orenia metallireducens]PRX35647.1 starch phosphorylase [Orenia metallireducens]SNY15514.1 starch phosphorylase [Orenia metallireducens]
MANQEPKVAYFCMEYGITSDFKIYSGGLGILAGDHMKAAYDQNRDLIGIGMLWKQGYNEQIIKEGRPYKAYPVETEKYDFLQDTGVKVKVEIRERDVWCKVWKVDCFNNADLYLLDTDLPENYAGDEWITDRLYGGFNEHRIAQEMVLSIGGVRALRALGIEPDVYHFNDSHPVFAGIELLREKMEDEGMWFDDALREVRKNVVFTTHTPVAAGNEVHPHKLLKYMGAYLHLNTEQMVAIGDAPFSMTAAGLRLSRNANSVASLHEQTANEMWSHVDGAAPIVGITNGVHRGTWTDERVVSAFEGGDTNKIWDAHQAAKQDLLDLIEERNGVKLDPNKLLIGFARRAAPYKRSDFIFSKPEVIEEYLKSGEVQIVFAGKAHPLDNKGREIVARLIEMADKYSNSVVFLEDYDMVIGAALTRGCDIWLNNPRRPKEASGTSGMKAAMNGVLNLSILDGWWPEACNHGVNGWAISPDGVEAKTAEDFEGSYDEKIAQLDEYDVNNLYDILLNQVLPTYADKEKWVGMMKESHKDTYVKFSADRMLNDYYRLVYAPENN